MYVPTLAEAIVKAQQAGTWTGAALAGIAVGNGCSGSEVGVCAQSDEFSYFRWAYLQQTAFVSSRMKAAIASTCNWTAADPSPSPSCSAVLQQAAHSISHINLYNVYGDCISGTYSPTPARHPHSPSHSDPGGCPVPDAAVRAPSKAPGLVSGRFTARDGGPDACINSREASAYFNRKDVQGARACACEIRALVDSKAAAAIHVRAPGFCWSVCR
jgi:serine carboxypeptidase-like clade 1